MLPEDVVGGGGSMAPADDRMGVWVLDAGLELPGPPVFDRPIGGKPGPGPKFGDGIVNGYEPPPPVPLRIGLEPF
jgi:hypothetical protein